MFTIDAEHSCDVCEEPIHPVLICMCTLKYSGSECCLLPMESCLHHIFSFYRSRARSSLAGGNKVNDVIRKSYLVASGGLSVVFPPRRSTVRVAFASQ